ncbi:MAG: hypothetical protein LJE58_14595 [Thiogranum sp.]|jgi:hypothetical protein|nr:hypothetical protein [Thiogranum sp.]
MQVIMRVGILWVMAVLTMPAVAAPGIDLHWLWDDRCAECHGHAGDFARKFLCVSGGRLQGRHHVEDLHGFLRNHYLAGNEVDAVYNMLLAQASNQARFKDECSSCHETAATFVRNALELRDGVLYGRNSGRSVGDFLKHHRGLTPEDAGFFTNLLTRVAREVYRP